MNLRAPILAACALTWLMLVSPVIDLDASMATIAVSEVWTGEVPAVVQVHGLAGPDPRDPESDVGPVVSEDDRSWTIGTTYLVVPTVDGEIFLDHPPAVASTAASALDR